MNKPLVCTAIALVLLVMTFAVPLRRGERINCDDGVIERMQLIGLPLTFSKATGAGDMICTPKSQPWASTRLTATFNSTALWSDVIIDMVILVGIYATLMRGFGRRT